MKPPRPGKPAPTDERTEVPFTNWRQRTQQRLNAFQFRALWWNLLDRWETRRSFRWTMIGLVAGLLVFAAAAIWGYPWWTKRNSVKMAREWLAAGRINYAVEAVQQAIQLDPKNPAPWQIAADIARLRGQKEKAAEYAHHASSLAPENSTMLIAWAAEALRADMPGEAEQALGQVSHRDLEQSPDAQRLLGEIARRAVRLDEARSHFEAALRLDGPVAVDEVPLGFVLLNAKDPTLRQRGEDLLGKWTADHEWGVVALRALLADAQARDDHPAMLKWAEALRVHPGFANGDMPGYLLVLSKTNPPRFAEVLTALEKDHAVSPEAASRLLGWLNQIGYSAQAVTWMNTLPAAAMHRPPLVLAGAEALRQVADWPALQAWTNGESWGAEGDFLRWAYGLQAALMLGDKMAADGLWQTLYSHAQLNGVHALFAGSTLYSWGRESQAEALWWRTAEQDGAVAIDALGSLARHYQTHRDADGQYRVFRRWHLLHPHDAAAGNNFSFFAALTGRDQRQAEQTARENLASEPQNQIYVATLAFNFFMQGKSAESLALLKPLTGNPHHSPAVSFVYGLALAGTGKKTEAHTVLDGIAPETLTKREVEIIQTALNN